MLQSLLTRLNNWLFEPPDSVIGKPLWLILRVLRYGYALARDLARGELTLRAMSLVYTTLLSIVPLIAFSFSVLKGLGFHHNLEPILYQFFAPLGDKASDLTARVMGFVENVRSDVLGSLGLGFLLYTVISMIQKIEDSFNFVWGVDQLRSFGRRFSEYLSVMLIGPVLIASAFGLLASLSSQGIVAAVLKVQPFGTLLLFLGRLTPYLLVTLVFTFMYAFVPNTKVQLRAAFTGGLVAGVLWAAVGALFASFVARSTQTLAIYAGFAIVIVALTWLYVSWLILLIGAQLSFYVQNPQFLRPGHAVVQLTSRLRERLALTLMYTIACEFRTGTRHWSANTLAAHFDLPGPVLMPVLNALRSRGLLVTTDSDMLVPGKDLDSIELAEIFDAVRNEPAPPQMPRVRSLDKVVEVANAADAALRASLAGKTLKDLTDGAQHCEI